MLINFHFLVMKAFIQNLVQNGSEVSEKIRFEFLNVHDLGPRSRNDLDLPLRVSTHIEQKVKGLFFHKTTSTYICNFFRIICLNYQIVYIL